MTRLGNWVQSRPRIPVRRSDGRSSPAAGAGSGKRHGVDMADAANTAAGIRSGVSHRLATNAYRTLGLFAAASANDTHEAAGAIRRAAKLGISRATNGDLAALGEVPRSENDIRGAQGRLASPLARLWERLFWFHSPIEGDSDTRDIRVRASENLHASVAAHDEALKSIVLVSIQDPDVKTPELWIKALELWADVLSDEGYWDQFEVVEKNGGFEPEASSEEIARVRDEAPSRILTDLAIVAKDGLVHSDYDKTKRVLTVLRSGRDSPSAIAEIEEDILGPLEERLEKLCIEVRRACGDGIKRDDHSASVNRDMCEAALGRFDQEVVPALHRFLSLVDNESEMAGRARGASALCLHGLAIDYTWADDFTTSQRLLQKARGIAGDSVAAARIREALEGVADSARKERIWKGLKPITSAPSLSTINGFGFRMYGRSDEDSETGSYLTTYYFVALWIPVFPICRYRIIDSGLDSYRFLGKAPLRSVDRWHLGIVIAAILGFVILAAQEQPSYSTSTRRSRETRPTAGAARSPTRSQPQVPRVPAGRAVLDQRLASLKSQIDEGRVEMNTLDRAIASLDHSTASLQSQLDAFKGEIEGYERRVELRMYVNEVAYEQAIESHNALIPRLKAEIAQYNQRVSRYNELVEQDKRLVAEYNSLIR